MKQKIQAQMLAIATVVDDGRDARRAPKGVRLAVFSQFLKAFGLQDKKHRKYQCFWRLAVFTKIFALGSKNNGIYSVFWTAPSKKHWFLQSVHHVARNMCSMQKSQNPVNYSVLICFEFAFRVRAGVEGGS